MLCIKDGILEKYYAEENESEVVVPSDVKIIGFMSFAWSPNLRKITILDGVKTIEYGAFYGCNNLEEIVMPESVENIGNAAFTGCKKLVIKFEGQMTEKMLDVDFGKDIVCVTFSQIRKE